VTPTLADGLAVPKVGPHAFEVAKHYVDECVMCTEKEISLAVLRLIENEKMVVEGGESFADIYESELVNY
jgi:threonine dehydratase